MGGDVRSPMRGAPFSQDLDRGDGFEKDTLRKYFFTCVIKSFCAPKKNRPCVLQQESQAKEDTLLVLFG